MKDDETDDSQAKIDFWHERCSYMDIDEVMCDTSNQADAIWCKIRDDIDSTERLHQQRERGNRIDWFLSDACDQWQHNKHCTKHAIDNLSTMIYS